MKKHLALIVFVLAINFTGKVESESNITEREEVAKDNLCDPNPCQNNGTCLRANQTYSCNCTELYDGKNCSEKITSQNKGGKRKRCLRCNACHSSYCEGHPGAVCSVIKKKCGCGEVWWKNGRQIKCGKLDMRMKVYPHSFCGYTFTRFWKACKPITLMQWKKKHGSK